MNQGDRLRKARKTKGLSQEALAKAIGISRVTVTQIESGSVKSIDGINLIRLAEELNVSPSWISTGKGEQSIETKYDRSSSDIGKQEIAHMASKYSAALVALKLSQRKVLIPIYEDIEASAGGGSINNEEIAKDHMLVEKKWLQETVGQTSENMAIIKVTGDSMEPTLSSGDMILVDLTSISRNNLHDGVYVITRNETTHVKRLQNLETGIRIISDNKAYETETVTDGLTVCGRVIWAWRGKRF